MLTPNPKSFDDDLRAVFSVGFYIVLDLAVPEDTGKVQHTPVLSNPPAVLLDQPPSPLLFDGAPVKCLSAPRLLFHRAHVVETITNKTCVCQLPCPPRPYLLAAGKWLPFTAFTMM